MAGTDSAVNVLAQGSSPIDTVQYTTGFGSVQRQRVEIGSWPLTGCGNVTSAANTNGVLTIAGIAGRQHHIVSVDAGWNGATVANSSITISANGNNQMNFPANAFPVHWFFGDMGFGTPAGNAATITVGAGGVGIVGFIGVVYLDY